MVYLDNTREQSWYCSYDRTYYLYPIEKIVNGKFISLEDCLKVEVTSCKNTVKLKNNLHILFNKTSNK